LTPPFVRFFRGEAKWQATGRDGDIFGDES
jgi:hypothetical protein